MQADERAEERAGEWAYKHKKGVPEGTPFLYRTIGSERPRPNHKNYFSAKYALMSASSRMF